jgi:hypothetical protein
VSGPGNGRGIASRPPGVEADTGRGPAETAPPPGQPWLHFEVSGVGAIENAAAPTLSFTLDAEDRSGLEVFTAALTIQIQIEPIKRTYEAEERERLAELFGEPHRWSTSAQRMLWTIESVLLPPFSGATTVEVPVQCNYDLELAATRYFHTVEGGEIPLSLHFNGSVYYAGENGRLQIVQIPWDTAAGYRMPLRVWKEMIDAYYPYRGWLPLQRETLEALRRRKAERGLPTYDQAVLELLEEAEE